MKFALSFLLAIVLVVPIARGFAQSPEADSSLMQLSAAMGDEHAATLQGPLLDLEQVERAALAENPEIHVAVRRVSAAEAHVPTAGTLDDPQFMVRSWGVPLAKPWDYNQAQNMLMVAQSLPGPGKRGLRAAVARADVTVAQDDLSATRLRVRVEVRKAFYDLLRAQQELRIHDEHVGIARQAIEAARIKYTVGKIPQVEILKAQVALTRLAEHMIRFQRDAEVARARLNALLGRDAGAPLQIRGDLNVDGELPAADVLLREAMQQRPDLMQAAASEDKSRREQSLAKKTYVPDFSVSAGYMLMPPSSDMRNNYMLEGSMTLPWLNRGRHDAELAEAAAAVAEKSAEVAAMQNAIGGQIGEARAEAVASQRLAKVYQDTLRPQAQATLHASVVAYENDQASFLDLLDSQMTVIDLDLAWVEALAEYNLRLAELEFAVGAPVEPKKTAPEVEK